MMKRIFRARNVLPMLTVCLAVAGAGLAQAAPIIFARVTVSPSFSDGTFPFDLSNQSSGQPMSVTGSATGAFNSSGAGSAQTEWGVIKVAGRSSGALNTRSSGFFRENIVISALGVASGTQGSLTYTVHVLGDMDVDSSLSGAASQWQLTADVGGGAFDISKTGRLFNDSFVNSGYMGDAFGTYSATVNFTYGVATPIYVEIEGNAQSFFRSNSGLALANADFRLDNSVYWGGIDDVFAGGNAIDAFTVTSESGTNYANSFLPVIDPPNGVPEPGSLALMLAGLGLITARSSKLKFGLTPARWQTLRRPIQ
jgi:PEP-CTERM motif